MKSTFVAYVLWFFLGGIGIHRFYLRRPISGVIFILTLGGLGIWALIDAFLIPGMVRIANLEWQKQYGSSNQNQNTNTNIINIQLPSEVTSSLPSE